MRSMTGYGKGDASGGGLSLTCEVKTVNHRYLDVAIRLPRELAAAEIPLRKRVAERFARGHAEVALGYAAGAAPSPLVGSNLPLAREYVRAAKALGDTAGVKGQLKLSVLLALPDVLYQIPLETDPDATLQTALLALEAACDAADLVRQEEGERLRAYFVSLLTDTENTLSLLADAAQAQPRLAREKLEKRLAGMQDIQADPQRLAQEIALFADRADISEEINRLTAHCARMRGLLDATSPAGREMDFLTQEMNREANTICSKSASLKVTEMGLALKAFADKIREQVQNVE